MNTPLAQAVRRLDDRRRSIEALILFDLELAVFADPGPPGDLDTDRHAGAAPLAGTHNASPYRAVTWEL